MDYKILFALTSFLVLLNACDRNAGGKAKLSIQFPEISSASQKVTTQAVSGSSDDWSSIIPTGFTGTAPINCFGIYVSGPEAALQVNQCGRKNSAAPMKVFGKWNGVVPGGKSIDVEVEAGNNRVVGVFGFHASDESACKNITGNVEPDKTKLSRPYFLGEATGVQFPAGKTIEVPVTMTFDSKQWFEDCKGPDFPNSNGGGGDTTPSTPSFADFGTGADGDFTISTGLADPRSLTSTAKGVPLITTTRVMSLNASSVNPKNLTIETKSGALTTKFVVGDEVALYIAAGNNCGSSVVVGFRTRGIVQTVSASELNINVDDQRFASIPTSALSATAAGSSRNFCRMVVTRVPHFNNLTFNGTNGATISFNAASFGDMTNDALDHEAGIIIIRVKEKITMITRGGIDLATRGFAGGGYSKDGQGFDGANTATPTTAVVLGSGGSGGSSSPSVHPGGGGHGGAGGHGLANGFGGVVIGDQFGCSSTVADSSMKCLFGKIFMGGGGGGGYDASGGAGGGLIILDAKIIDLKGNSFLLSADGSSSSGGSTMGGAGGAAGSVRVTAQDIIGGVNSDLKLRSNGGYSKTSSGLGLGRGGSGGGGRNHLHVTGACSLPDTAIALEAYSPAQFDSSAQGFAGGIGTNFADGAGIESCNVIAKNITPYIARFYPTSVTADTSVGATFKIYGDSLKAVTVATLQNTVTPASEFACVISNKTDKSFDCTTTAPAAQYHLIVVGAGGRKTLRQSAITLN